jgi:hypothetical protein
MKKVGRPAFLKGVKRVIVQIEDTQVKAIKEITEQKDISVSHFFRVAAQDLLDNPQKLGGNL